VEEEERFRNIEMWRDRGDRTIYVKTVSFDLTCP
jgi:hypothetical protein